MRLVANAALQRRRRSTDRCKTLRMSYDPSSPPPSSRTQRPSVNDDEAPKPQDISVERANGPARSGRACCCVVLCRCVLFRVVPAKDLVLSPPTTFFCDERPPLAAQKKSRSHEDTLNNFLPRVPATFCGPSSLAGPRSISRLHAHRRQPHRAVADHNR